MNYPNTLSVSPCWVSDRLNDESVVILDIRAGTSHFAYTRGHIPAARPLSLPHCKSAVLGTPDCLDEEAMATQLGALGVEPHQTVVLYDEAMSQNVTFGFWALEYMGQHTVVYIEGGLKAWQSADLPITPEEPTYPSTSYPLPTQSAHRRIAADMAVPNAARAVLDVRGPQEYVAAHIPNAINCNWIDLVEDPATLQFLPAAALAAKFATLGITPDDEIVTYCRSGTRASVVYTALRLMGWERVRLYDGSMNDWLLREYPVVRGNV